MMQEIIQTLMAMLGAVGFSILFNVSNSYINILYNLYYTRYKS